MKIAINVFGNKEDLHFLNAVQMLMYYLQEQILNYQKNVDVDGYLKLIDVEIEGGD